MKTVQFKDVPINSEFIFESRTYIKTEPQRVSCCRTLNCVLKDNPAEKTMIRLEANVEIADDQPK